MGNAQQQQLQQQAMQLQQQAMAQQLIFQITEICWDKCMAGKPGQALENKQADCISQFAQRYIEAKMFVFNRMQHQAQQQQGQH
jgi:hypothetical protein